MKSRKAAAIDAWFNEKRNGLIVVTGFETLNELADRGVLAVAPLPKPMRHDRRPLEEHQEAHPVVAALAGAPDQRVISRPSGTPQMIHRGVENPSPDPTERHGSA